MRRPGGPVGPRRPSRPSGGPGGPAGPNRPHLAKDELRYHGDNACLALWQSRPKDVVRVYILKERSDYFAELLEWCSKNRRSYHLVGESDLERLTDTKHHEGICLVAKEKPSLSGQEFLRQVGSGRSLLLYLDGVGNPHNLGAILRTAAHFGVKYVAGPSEQLPRISAAANRTSEGGAEHVALVRVDDPPRFLQRLKEIGFQVYAFDPDEKAASLFEARLGDRAVFILGAEVTGVSEEMFSLADLTLKIPGTGVIESLNVSVASALAMAEFQRQGQRPSVRIVKSPPRG